MKSLRFLLSMSALVLASSAYADGDLSRVDPIEVIIEMGHTDKAMWFEPAHIELVTGKAYKLVLKNVDSVKHEFAGPEFVGKVFTRKVEIADAAGKMIAEVKGTVTEVEVGPGGVVEWFIVPVQTGENIPIECAIKGHKEAGMVGTITIK